MNVTYFFRKRRKGSNSIEELFGGIIDILQPRTKIAQVELPLLGASPTTIYKNSLFARKHGGNINHITGDVHYVAMALGKNTILTVHDVYSAIQGNWLKRNFIKLLWFTWPARSVDAITAISEFSRQELIKIIPFAANKIKVVYNPYRKELLQYKARKVEFDGSTPVKIMLVGTKKNKNIERTVRALKGLNVEVQVLGKLSEHQHRLLKETEVSYQTFYNLTYDDVIKTYVNSDLLCFTSTYEGFGLPIIEAQVLGIPVITSNIGAMKEIAADSAHLVDPFNEQDIRDGVEKLMSNADYRKLLIKKGYENIKRFEPQKIADKYVEIYEQVFENE